MLQLISGWMSCVPKKGLYSKRAPHFLICVSDREMFGFATNYSYLKEYQNTISQNQNLQVQLKKKIKIK